MKRIVTAVLMVFCILFGLVGCMPDKGTTQGKKDNTPASQGSSEGKTEMVSGTSSALISADSAKKIAFMHAGVNESDLYDLEVEFDKDDGVQSYEIEFKADGVEYDYDIHAVSGEILKAEKDGKSTMSNAATHKSADEAKAIAFAHAGILAEMVYDLEVEFDEDDGIQSYEIEFKSKGDSYEYDIHAVTGEILKSEKDKKD